MTSGPPLASDAFDNWIAARLDEKVPVAFLAGLPTENDGLLQRLGIRRLSQKLKVKPVPRPTTRRCLVPSKRRW